MSEVDFYPIGLSFFMGSDLYNLVVKGMQQGIEGNYIGIQRTLGVKKGMNIPLIKVDEDPEAVYISPIGQLTIDGNGFIRSEALLNISIKVKDTFTPPEGKMYGRLFYVKATRMVGLVIVCSRQYNNGDGRALELVNQSK